MRRRKTKSILCKYAVAEKQLFPQAFTRFYTLFLSAKKRFNPSHNARFLLIYKGFECEGLDFQVFTSTVAFISVSLLIFGRFSGVKAYSFHPSQAFTARVNALLPMWTLWNQNLHTRNLWKSAENTRYVKGWILFSGNQMRIHARAWWGKSIPWAWLGRLPSQVAE